MVSIFYFLKNSMKQPVLSVVMPVYNGEKYLREAIDSVLNQTFPNFEFIVINDGSTDLSVNIIETYNDDRIRFINNEINYGIPYSRNLGLQLARGEFLTWTDCDDINLPSRFDEQVAFLKNNNEFGICGTWLKRIGSEKQYLFKAYKDPELVKAILLFRPSIPNATAMLRLSKIKEFNLLYNTNLPISEDYDFILRCSMFFPLTNIPKVLYLYRASETSIMKKFESLEKESYNIDKVVYTKALTYLGIRPTESDLITHRLTCSAKMVTNFSDLITCYKWLKVIKLKNDETKVYDPKAMNKALAYEFYFISRKASNAGLTTLKFYITKSFQNFGYVSIYRILKLTIRCLLKYNKI